jgi:lipoprotein-releasing system permease protein
LGLCRANLELGNSILVVLEVFVILSSVEWHVVGRYLRAQRKSLFVSFIALFSMLGVAIGTFALVIVLSGINGFEREVTSQMMGKDAHADLVQYGHEPMADWEKILQKVEQTPTVVAAGPFIVSKVGISSRSANDGIVIYGIDDARSRKILTLHQQIGWGEYRTDSIPDTLGSLRPGIMLGLDLASRLNVRVGDKVVLQTFQSPDAATGPVLVQCVVAGVFQTGMYEYDANLAYVSIGTAQRLLGIPGRVTGVHFNLEDPWKSSEVTAQLTQELGPPYVSSDWKQKNETLLKWMGLEKILFGGVISLIILVAAFNIISSLIMLVTEKTREIGIMRAMGFSAASILRIFVAIGGAIGFVGTILGTTVGLILAWTQMQYGWVKLPPDVYLFAKLPMYVEMVDVVAVFVVSNLICLLATIPPALKAAFLHPVKAIRHE